MRPAQQSGACPPPDRISALLDGDLAPEEAAATEAHLARCPACRAVREELDGMRQGLTGLLAADAPPADLWPRIARAHRLVGEERRVPWWRRPWLLAPVAAAAAALLLVVAVGERGRPKAARGDELARAYTGVLQAERTYVEAIDALERAAAGHAESASPAVREALARSLAEIDATVAQCRRQLRQAPYDFEAHRMLLAAYQRKIDLLNDVVGPSI